MIQKSTEIEIGDVIKLQRGSLVEVTSLSHHAQKVYFKQFGGEVFIMRYDIVALYKQCR